MQERSRAASGRAKHDRQEWRTRHVHTTNDDRFGRKGRSSKVNHIDGTNKHSEDGIRRKQCTETSQPEPFLAQNDALHNIAHYGEHIIKPPVGKTKLGTL